MPPVKAGQFISDFKTVSCGVPQGNVLGLRHCYNLYISAPNGKFGKNIQSLQIGLNTSLTNITNWLKAMNLTLDH